MAETLLPYEMTSIFYPEGARTTMPEGTSRIGSVAEATSWMEETDAEAYLYGARLVMLELRSPDGELIVLRKLPDDFTPISS